MRRPPPADDTPIEIAGARRLFGPLGRLRACPGQVLKLHILARAGAFWSNTWFTLHDEAVDPPLSHLPDATRAGFGDYRALLSFAGRFRDLHDMSPECEHWTDWVPESFEALIFRQPG